MRALRIGFPFRTNDFPFSALTHSFTRRNCLTVQGPGWTLGNSDAWMSFEGGTAERATRAPRLTGAGLLAVALVVGDGHPHWLPVEHLAVVGRGAGDGVRAARAVAV